MQLDITGMFNFSNADVPATNPVLWPTEAPWDRAWIKITNVTGAFFKVLDEAGSRTWSFIPPYCDVTFAVYPRQKHIQIQYLGVLGALSTDYPSPIFLAGLYKEMPSVSYQLPH
jgi:hypothetical protein